MGNRKAPTPVDRSQRKPEPPPAPPARRHFNERQESPWVCQRCGAVLAETNDGQPLHHRRTAGLDIVMWACPGPALVPFFNFPWVASRSARKADR